MKKNNRIYIYIFMCLYLAIFGFKTIVLADDLNCNSWGNVIKDLQNLFDFAKIVVPLLVIGLSSYDFIKAITSKEAKDIKKAYNTLLKRLGLAIIFFFLPMLINLFLEMININSDVCVK